MYQISIQIVSFFSSQGFEKQTFMRNVIDNLLLDSFPIVFDQAFLVCVYSSDPFRANLSNTAHNSKNV